MSAYVHSCISCAAVVEQVFRALFFCRGTLMHAWAGHSQFFPRPQAEHWRCRCVHLLCVCTMMPAFHRRGLCVSSVYDASQTQVGGRCLSFINLYTLHVSASCISFLSAACFIRSFRSTVHYHLPSTSRWLLVPLFFALGSCSISILLPLALGFLL